MTKKLTKKESALVADLEFFSDASDLEDPYTVGFKNGLIFAKSLITNENPKFEEVKSHNFTMFGSKLEPSLKKKYLWKGAKGAMFIGTLSSIDKEKNRFVVKIDYPGPIAHYRRAVGWMGLPDDSLDVQLKLDFDESEKPTGINLSWDKC